MAFSATHEFGRIYAGSTRVLSVQANGGAVSVDVEHAPGVWITSDTITEDYVGELVFGHANLRIVPSGGATFAVH
jgi:hypothetical protein